MRFSEILGAMHPDRKPNAALTKINNGNEISPSSIVHQQKAIRDWLNMQNITIDADVPEHIPARVVKPNGERFPYF